MKFHLHCFIYSGIGTFLFEFFNAFRGDSRIFLQMDLTLNFFIYANLFGLQEIYCGYCFSVYQKFFNPKSATIIINRKKQKKNYIYVYKEREKVWLIWQRCTIGISETGDGSYKER